MSSFTEILQAQINADIQSIKSGLVDIDALRTRIEGDDADPDNPYTSVVLWLVALATGLIDHLEVEVSEKDGKPEFTFYPEIIKSTKDREEALILKLPVPGPKESPPTGSYEDETSDLALID